MDTLKKILTTCSLVCLFVHVSVCQPRQGAQATETCSKPCPPHWVDMLVSYSSLVDLRGNGAVCRFAQKNGLITACNSTGVGCSANPTTPFVCCPTSCLSSIAACYQGPPTTYYCLPQTLTEWMADLMRLFG